MSAREQRVRKMPPSEGLDTRQHIGFKSRALLGNMLLLRRSRRGRFKSRALLGKGIQALGKVIGCGLTVVIGMHGNGSNSTDTQRVMPSVLVYRSLGSSLPMLLGPIALVDATHDVSTFEGKLNTGAYDFVVCEVRSGADARHLLSLLHAVPKQAKVVLYSYAAPAELPALRDQSISVLHGASVSSELLRLIQSGGVSPRVGSSRPTATE